MDPISKYKSNNMAWIPQTSSASAAGNSQSSHQSQQQQQQQQQQPQQQQRLPSTQLYPSPETSVIPPAHPSKRTRISRACDTCRKKKIKCDVDNCHPCTTCKQYDWECTFNDTARKRGPPKGYIESLEARLLRMEQLLGQIQNDDDKSTTHHGYDTNMTTTSTIESLPTSSTSSQSPSGANSPQSPHASVESEPVTNSNLPPKGKVVRFLGSSSGLYLVNDILKNKDNRNSETTNSNGTSIGKTNGTDLTSWYQQQQQRQQQQQQSHLHSTTSLQANNNNTTSPSTTKEDDNFTSLETKQGTYRLRRMNRYDDDLVMVRDETEDESRIQAAAADEQETMDSIIPRSMLASLIKVYFEAHCPTLPILDEEEFVNAFEGKTSPPPSPLLTYAICSYSCFLVPSNHPIFTRSGLERNQIFHTLVDRAGLLIRTEYLTPRIQTIQALILLCAHPTYSSGSYRNWILAGMAVRMAQDLGLHRSVSNTNAATELIEKRRRLWYSVYLTDRWCCSVMGRPLAIADSDCDVDLPQADCADEPGRYTMFVNLVKLSGILGEVLRRIYSPKGKAMGYGTSIMEQTVWSLDKMLKEWFDQVPAECRITQDQLREMKGMEHTQRDKFRSGGPLTVCYYAVVVLLFRPFIVFECNNHHGSRLFNEAPKRCMDAAKNSIDVARHTPGIEIVRYGWNFAAYSIFQAALIHVYNCTSNDPVVAQMSRDYIRISIDECIVPMTNDIPYGPPVVQFLENLLYLMKADPSVYRSSSNGDGSSSTQPTFSSSTIPTTSATTGYSQQQVPSMQHPTSSTSYSTSSSNFGGMTNDTTYNTSTSPMSVHQIVSGIEQTSNTTTGRPPSTQSAPVNNNGANQTSGSNPVDLITLALTQDSLLGNESNPMMTQATWQYLFSSAGTPFSNNATGGSDFQGSWENMFMESQGNANFIP
ncbi:fungal-specific transcription factor domain-containing protein, partial [Halteromyces radiatus]|uniref:fungal-specific transcription factor domain-containing protein n=1 Tax=Halteromyces radiatus TaxID=101107 RepID=UPI00221EBB8B